MGLKVFVAELPAFLDFRLCFWKTGLCDLVIRRQNDKYCSRFKRFSISTSILQIKRCIESYYNGKISEAYNCIKNILEQYVKSPFIVAMIDENYAFRGSAVEKIRPENKYK